MTNSDNVQANNPLIILKIAPILDVDFQNSPAVNGKNKETKLNDEDIPTNSYIFDLLVARNAAQMATPTTESLIV